MKEVQKLQKVEILRGLFRNVVGVVTGQFEYSGRQLLSIKIPKQMNDGELYYNFATVNLDDVRVTNDGDNLLNYLVNSKAILLNRSNYL